MHFAERRANSLGLGVGVITLLILIAGAIGVVSYLRIKQIYRVTAYLELKLTPTSPQSIALAHQACVDLLRSPAVVKEVLNDGPHGAGLRQLPTVARQPNAAAWLAKRLQISFAANSPILEITLSGREFAGDSWGDDAQLLYKLIASFERAIVNPPPVIAAKLGGPAAVNVIQKPVVTHR